MDDPVWIYVLLCVSALFAGAVNSIAGGGTLLTFPALMRVVDDLQANGTSTVALLPGSFAGAVAYRKELAGCKKLIRILIWPSLVGGILGALLATQFPKLFSGLVPWLILTASMLFLLQGWFKKLSGKTQFDNPSRRMICGVIAGQFLIAIYGGYFGAGIGILMLSVLPFMGTTDIHQTNAVKTLLASVINAVTIVVFIAAGQVVWPYAWAMAGSAIVGGYLGARGARKLPASSVRAIVITIGFGLSAYYIWDRFLKG
jgi:uncharacterized protein